MTAGRQVRNAAPPALSLRKPAHSRRFLFTPEISRCEKIFCVVKNHAAWHNQKHCGMENRVPQ
ncbi:hypothetical protein EZV77_01205 [Burkholderia thailandensis]|nr:hypothetical protein EZV77_01205 [Burkholderia thailandensis]